jgi:AraC family transcriptional regulator
MSGGDPNLSSPVVDFSPSGLVDRRLSSWPGLRAETVRVTRKEPFEYGFRASHHLLIACDRAYREDGETFVEGLPKSSLRDFSRRLTLVPAGRVFRGWQRPRVLTNVTYFYIDPREPQFDPEPLGNVELAPRLFFVDHDLWQTASKLKALIGRPTNTAYAEALSMVLVHELVRIGIGAARMEDYNRGGLASWQQKRVAEFIDEHLPESVALATLAEIARLSPFHFARAFKRSFGVPPHRYHVARRITRAKSLLREPARSVTEVAFQLGFHEPSSFAAAFRKLTGVTPTQYRRSVA